MFHLFKNIVILLYKNTLRPEEFILFFKSKIDLIISLLSHASIEHEGLCIIFCTSQLKCLIFHLLPIH